MDDSITDPLVYRLFDAETHQQVGRVAPDIEPTEPADDSVKIYLDCLLFRVQPPEAGRQNEDIFTPWGIRGLALTPSTDPVTYERVGYVALDYALNQDMLLWTRGGKQMGWRGLWYPTWGTPPNIDPQGVYDRAPERTIVIL